MLGRYPIHYHMIGTVHHSYVRGNSVYKSFNRATTIHGVHFLQVVDNVYWDIDGHVVFIEDAAETKNLIQNNLVMNNHQVWSLLNSDATSPACFWITNPDNIFIGNHAVGCNKGFYFSLPGHSTGPSKDLNICPKGTSLGEFRDNVAHSNSIGLRIHSFEPR